jgi:hypothetical protein
MDLDNECEQDEKIETIDVIATNGDRYNITKLSAKLSKVISAGIEDDPDCKEITLNIDSIYLKYICEYLNHYTTTIDNITFPKTNKENKGISFENAVDLWANKFISSKKISTINGMINGANYLDIEPLLNSLACYIAHKIRGSSFKTICKEFGVTDVNLNQKQQQMADQIYKEIIKK